MAAALTIDRLPSEAAGKPSSPRLHLDYLDGLRACAALYVLLHHMYEFAGIEDNPHGLIEKLLNPFLRRGHYAVDVFITLSGFCLMLPIVRDGMTLRGGALAFFKRRARRILPPYYAALGISLALAMTVLRHKTGGAYDDCIPVDGFGIATHALLLQDLFSQTHWQINTVFWTIGIEWRIYFVLPFLIVLWRKIGAPAAALATLAFSFVLLAVLKHTPLDTDAWGCNPQYLGLFAIGCLGATISFSNDTQWQAVRAKAPWLVIAAATMVLIAVAQKPTQGGWTGALMDVLIAIATSTFLIGIRDKNHLANRLFSWRPLAKIGLFSYSLYLIHAPLLQIAYLGGLRRWNDRSLTEFALYLALTPVILAACYLFHIAFERPFMSGVTRVKAEA